jgi:type II secretory pathway pseudopilin PulG
MKNRLSARPAFSLLEVVLASAIFLIALVGLSQLLSVSSEQAIEIQRMNRAAQLLESKMNEVIAGVESLTSRGETPFDEDPDWVWSLAVEPESTPGLYRVTVTVAFARDPDRNWNVTQFVLDPTQRGGMEAPAVSGTAAAATSGGP